MNQILNFGNNRGTQNEASKPVIKFFVGIIILFALILIGEGAYNLATNKKNNNVSGTPIISAVQDGSSVVLTAEYKDGIEKVIYHWNNGEEAIMQAHGKTKLEEKISMPIGTNKLNVSVIDKNGKMTRFTPIEFVFDSNIDTNKPIIDITKGTSTGTIKLIITDDKALKSVTYQWDGDDAIIPEMQAGVLSFELEVAVKEGERSITVTAIDSSDNEQKITKTIKGSKKPEISAVKDGQVLTISSKDDDKIGKIEYNFNGTTNVIENINQPTYDLKLNLISGENYVIVTVYDVDGLSAVYKGKCNY